MPSKDKIKKQKEKQEQKEKELYEKQQDEYWSQGTNKKAEKKAIIEHEKQMEKLQKAKEKKELEEADNEMFTNVKINVKKSKKKKGDDLDLLNQALKNAPKTKAQREIEQKNIEKINKQKQEEQLKIKKQKELEILERERQKNLAKNISYSHEDIMNVQINNKLDEDEEEVTGIDNILDVFSNNNSVMTYDEFYKQQIPLIKEKYPGLRLSQYKDKIFHLWKKSPYFELENKK